MRRLALAFVLLSSAAVAAELPTPVAERVATIKLLDKRSGKVSMATMKPGQVARFDRLTIRLAACEATAPWEARPEVGAFVQIDERKVRGRGGGRVFSGWLFARSPGLNAFESRDYDVWPSACAMRFPESGADTVVAAPPARSKAKKSARRETASESNAL